jgi:hypothetical protein
MNKPFHKQFKKGDIICSDEFHDGKCVIVDHLTPEKLYHCYDLMEEKQAWFVREFYIYEENLYNWRIAKDDDIAAYLERYITTREESLNGIDVAITDDLLTIKDICGSVYMDMEQAAKLRDYLNKYVIGG